MFFTSFISVFNSSISANCFFLFASFFLSKQCFWRSCFKTKGYLVSLRSEWWTVTWWQSSWNQFWTLTGNFLKHPIRASSWNSLVDRNLRTELMISIWDINWSLLPVFIKDSISETARPTSKFMITRQNTNMNRIINTIAVPKKIKIGVVHKIFIGGWWLIVRMVKNCLPCTYEANKTTQLNFIEKSR